MIANYCLSNKIKSIAEACALIDKATRDFNPRDMDLLFAILSKIDEVGVTIDDEKDRVYIKLHLSKITEIINYNGTYEELIKDLPNLLWSLSISRISSSLGCIGGSLLFNRLSFDEESFSVDVEFNSAFWAISRLYHEMGFSLYELKEYLSIKDKASQQIYFLLKQYENTGGCTPDGQKILFEVKDIRQVLDIEGKGEYIDILNQVVNPINSQLSRIFKDLSYTTSKDSSRKIKGYSITFRPYPHGSLNIYT